MKIIECYIENFGKLSAKKFDFSDGFNTLLAENGYGKTTLSVFIKCMLYGMSDTKKMSLDENERKRYLPWSGAACSGSLTFKVGDKLYRVERIFAPKAADDRFKLYDLTLGRESEDYSENLGEELFGIDADGFERTVFLSERALTPKSENKSVSAKLSDLVGCDGDIGVMDDAMKALEDRRKFYFKKGGAGELASIKSKITEATVRLEYIEDVEKELDGLEKRSVELSLALNRLEEGKTALMKEREDAALAEARAELTKHHEELLAELAALREKRRELLDFFGGTPPTFGEISANALKLTEAEGIEKKASEKEESKEYTALKGYLDGKTDKDEIDSVKATLLAEKSRKALITSSESVMLRSKFSKRIPTHGELDELITLATRGNEKEKRTPKTPLLLVGIALAVLGICLGALVSLVLFALAALGVISIAMAFVGKKQVTDSTNKFDEFYLSVSGINAPAEEALLADLFDLKASISKAEALKSAEEQKDAEIFLQAFCAKFSCQNEDPVILAEEIVQKFSHFAALSVAEEYRISEKQKELARAAQLRDAANEFAARYPTKSESPFDEMRDRLNELDRVSKAVADKEVEAERFVRQYGSGEGAKARRAIAEIDRDLADTEEKTTVLRRGIAINERARFEHAQEIEEKDAIAIRLTELWELYEKHNENYNVILKTKEYLERAKDSMTAKYLGKTKAGFEKYAALIGGDEDGRFEMSTDFGVSKFEGASPKSTEAYSRGTRDLYNLAARLALVDSLYEGEGPFIILDDPFTAFDDEKTDAALKLLSRLGDERQIIYFTCSESRVAKAT